MRSVNLDPKLMIAQLVSNGIVSEADVLSWCRQAHGITKPVGYAKTEHGAMISFFISTDKDTKAVNLSSDGKRVKYNARFYDRSKQQTATTQGAQVQAQTPGQVLGGQPAGAPAFTPAQLAAAAQVLQSQGYSVAQLQVSPPTIGGGLRGKPANRPQEQSAPESGSGGSDAPFNDGFASGNETF